MKLLIQEDFQHLRDPFPERNQLLIISIKLSDDHLGTELDDRYVELLEMQLMELVEDLDYAHWDGHQYGSGYAEIFFFTTNVNKLYKHLSKALKSINFTVGSRIILQYGLPDSEQFIFDPTKKEN